VELGGAEHTRAALKYAQWILVLSLGVPAGAAAADEGG